MRYNTSDNDKKARDNQAHREVKNILREENRKAGQRQYSKKNRSSINEVTRLAS